MAATASTHDEPTGATSSVEPRVSPSPGALWFVRLLGAVEATRAGLTHDHWPTRAVAALLARLALQPDRVHPREELIELLWPGVALDVGRNRLRHALSSLRSMLEPRGEIDAPVLHADRLGVRVVAGALDCDARRFEQAARSGHGASAQVLYRGDLMPGFYDDWVIDERRRLADLHDDLQQLATVRAQQKVATPTDEPLAAVPRLPTGLPSYWTRGFGTDLVASRLHALLAAQRLVTVHGPGGSGKTRLAVQVAQAADDSGSLFDRVVFVPLLDRRDAEQALDAICGALRLGAEGEPQRRIVNALAGRRTLLLLDNVEQMVEAAGQVVTALLAAAPALHVLLTSRQLLEVDGEHAFELEGLPLPPLALADTAAAQGAAHPAVALFVDRARAARAEFRLDARNASAVAALTRLLGGMPLAIELAASRVRGLSPQELLARLSEAAGSPMLDLLARGTQRATEGARHASMRHVVAWSWQQLTPPQAALLRAMSVLASSARAETVAAVAGIGERAALLLLDSLRDASLVRGSDEGDGSHRFVLLQPVREYAAEQTSAAEASAARARLRVWLLNFARAATPRQPAAVAPEIAHVHASLISAVADGDGHAALELAMALRSYWNSDQLPLSIVQALEQVLADEGDAALRTDMLDLLAQARGAAGFVREAAAHAQQALTLASDDRRRSLALSRWVNVQYLGGHFDEPQLQAALDEASALAERSDDDLARATFLGAQGLITSNLRLDYIGAEALVTRALTVLTRMGRSPMATFAALNQATMWAWQGRNEEASAAMARLARQSQAEGDWMGLLHATRQHGRVLTRLRRWSAARDALRHSVRVGWQRNFVRGLANALLNLPQPLALSGQPEAAARLLGFAQGYWERQYGAINQIETRELRLARRLLWRCLGVARAENLRAEGALLELAAAVALALDEGAA